MKLWKKIFTLCMTIALGCGTAATAVACGGGDTTTSSSGASSSSNEVSNSESNPSGESSSNEVSSEASSSENSGELGGGQMDETAFNAAIAATRAATNLTAESTLHSDLADDSGDVPVVQTSTTYIADNKAYMTFGADGGQSYGYVGNVDGKNYMWVSVDQITWDCEEDGEAIAIDGAWLLADVLPLEMPFDSVTYNEETNAYKYVVSETDYVTLVFENGKIASVTAVYLQEEFGVRIMYTETHTITYDNATVGELPPVPDNTQPEPSEYVYRISVQNETGFGFRNVSVSLYDGETKIASKTTNSLGNANFTSEDVANVGEYTVVIDEMPAGYAYAYEDLTYTTVALANTSTLVQIAPQGVIKESMPADTRYDFGDVMYDFTVTLANGTQFTLSEELKTKDVVLINFWATWCNPCKMEFPAMHNAATLYAEDVTVLALSTTDSNQAVENFKSTNGFTQFKMGVMPLALKEAFGVEGIPHSVMVDRYGVVSFIHVGSMTSTSDFTTRFDTFNVENYKSTVLGTPTAGPDIGDEQENELIPPTEDVLAKKPTAAQIKTALSADNIFSFRFQEKGAEVGSDNYDEYTWPWLVGEDGNHLYAPNANMHNTYATLYVDFTAQVNDVLCFDYLLNSEADADILYVLIDGNPIHQLSGYHTKWQTCYAYVFQEGEAGEHELTIIFLKDNTGTVEDVVEINNLRIENLDDIKDSEGVDANVFRYAASGINTAPDATTQYVNYITPVYNEEDQYYHVGSKDGPILFANMLRASQWSNNSVWLLAFNDYVIDEDGINYHGAIEYFAWEANNSIRMLGYTAVTKELRQLLEITVSNVTIDQKWNGPNHANEWLECCVYYDHYGATPQMEDPMRGITFTGAIEMKEGNNQVDVLFEMVPRGFKYKFTPTKSGVYHVYSTGTQDPYMFLTSKTLVDNCLLQNRLSSLPLLGEFNDKLFMSTITNEKGEEVIDYNFEFFYYFEEGETYYMLLTTYDNSPATYNVTINYEGETYRYLQFAASNLYSANETTGAEYLPDAVDYYYSDPAQGGDGYYHEKKTGSILYLEVNQPSFFNPNYSLYEVCDAAIKKNVPVEERAFYVNGVDYTETLMIYCMQALQADALSVLNTSNPDPDTWIYLHGVPVTQELMTILQTITMKRYEGIEKSWLMMCYYYVTLGV